MGLTEAELDHALRRMGEVEAAWTAFLGLQREREEVGARAAAAGRMEMLNSISKTVRDAMREETARIEKLIDARFGEITASISARVEPLRSCLDEEERRRELLEAEVNQKPEREEFETLVKTQDRNIHNIELQTNGAVAALRTDIFDKGGVEPRLRKLEDAPGRAAIAAFGAAALAIITTKAPDIFEWFKSLKGGVPK